MIILVDTNIILDIFMDREPYTEEVRLIVTKCADREVIGYLAAHSIPNLSYAFRGGSLTSVDMSSMSIEGLRSNERVFSDVMSWRHY